jgi:hypothetical protein
VLAVSNANLLELAGSALVDGLVGLHERRSSPAAYRGTESGSRYGTAECAAKPVRANTLL